MKDYGTAKSTALADPFIHHRVLEYKRSMAGRMTGLDKEGIRKKGPAGEVYASRKIDGEFNVVVYNEGGIFMINPGGTIRVGLPLLQAAQACFDRHKIRQAIVPGELYFERGDGSRPRVHDVMRVARRPDTEDELASLKFAVFDIIEIDEEAVGPAYVDVVDKMENLFGNGELIHKVDTVKVSDADEIENIFVKWVEKEGAEGVVLRSDEYGMFKIKPRHMLDVVVVGFTEGSDEQTGLLHDMLIAVMRKEGTFHLLGRVGGGFSLEQRKAFLSDLKDLSAQSDYHEISTDRVAYQMVRPEWIIEISILDIVTQTTRNGDIRRMVLNWNHKEKRYEIVRPMPLASIISPQFIRKRDDKTVQYEDLRLSQISDLVEIPKTDLNTLKTKFTKSKMIQRKVCTKVLKGATMVRKLVLWKTNKEAESDDFPAYVVYATDFSPNRKTPLNRDIRVSNSKEQIEELWKQLEEKNFVKGWQSVD